MLPFCLIAILPLFAQTGSNPPLSAFEQNLIINEKALMDAIAKGRVDYVKNTVADDFLAIGTNGDMGGKGDLVQAAMYASQRKGNGKESEPILYDFKVVQLNDVAGVVTYNAVFPGDHPRHQHLSSTWVKLDGQWKLKFVQTTPNQWSAYDFD
jgi:hypothetical protein